MLKAPKELPEWFVIANSKAMFTAKEVSEIFGLLQQHIYGAIKVGSFPRGVVYKKIDKL